ncbi:hypothetical protein HDV64DRAFT_238832 [Trichoderma sp. TUCIM 5745]
MSHSMSIFLLGITVQSGAYVLDMHVLKVLAYSPTQSLSTRASVLPTQTPLPDLFSPYAEFVQSGIGEEHPEPERGTRG